MAVSKAKTLEEFPLIPTIPDSPYPRLTKLIVKNFRAIGIEPVEIDLDKIVILVGNNNAGKSSILRAYELAMSDGSNECKLKPEDFPNGEFNSDTHPTVEVHTVLSENNLPSDQWTQPIEDGQYLIRERWVWNMPNQAPIRQGYDVKAGEWSEKRPWRAPNVANAYRPRPYHIEAFSSPEKQEQIIAKLIQDLLTNQFKSFKKSSLEDPKTDFAVLLSQMSEFQKKIFDSIEEERNTIQSSISADIKSIFPGYTVEFDVSESDIDKVYSPFKEAPSIRMGPDDGYKSGVNVQGSGARRVLMWAALKYMAEHDSKGGERPFVLLFDEPELCLQPTAIRNAREVLYSLAAKSNWQVMITTHSPLFIDLSHDNTTIIRVDRDFTNNIKGTTLFRPETVKLDNDDRKNLKLLNVCDPYLHEFFFGGRIIVVEGDTEYTAFSLLKIMYPAEYSDVHIIRARGKAIIPSIAKILNQFDSSYAVLHDSDCTQASNGNKNPAWAVNTNILSEVSKSKFVVNLIACIKNFEDAIFGELVGEDKPYNAFEKIKNDGELLKKVKQLLDALLNINNEPPVNCVRWHEISDLEKRLSM